jgi:broad specificity polyphosphatase/5'/3'-nucleotidase SurE
LLLPFIIINLKHHHFTNKIKTTPYSINIPHHHNHHHHKHQTITKQKEKIKTTRTEEVEEENREFMAELPLPVTLISLS